jgi:hypothetical protein
MVCFVPFPLVGLLTQLDASREPVREFERATS